MYAILSPSNNNLLTTGIISICIVFVSAKRTIACFAIICTFIFADTVWSDMSIISIDQLKPGMQGYCLSVLSGTTPTRFPVELVDVVRGPDPSGHSLLVKTINTDLRLQTIAIGQGFSGSPIYFDNKLAGAIAYGESFQREMVFGVTLIGDMLSELTVARQHTTPQVSGIAFDKNQIEPGSMIMIPMVRGDLWIGTSGTVTAIKNDWLLAFGHSMGSVTNKIELPMHLARVNTVLAKLDVSHKIADGQQEIGSLVWDGRSAVAGVLGRKAAMIPFDITIKRATLQQKAVVKLEIIPQAKLIPSLMSMIILQTLEKHTITRLQNTDVIIDIKAQFADMESALQLSQRLRTATMSPQSITQKMTAFIDALPEHTKLTSLHVDLTELSDTQSGTIVRAHFNKQRARPGESVDVTITVANATFLEHLTTVSLQIPLDFAPGQFPIKVVPGDSVWPQEQQPTDKYEMLQWCSGFLRADDLVILAPAGKTTAAYAMSQIQRVVAKHPWTLIGSAQATLTITE